MTTIHLHNSADPESSATIIEVDRDISLGDVYNHDGVLYKAREPVVAINPNTGFSEVHNWEFVPA